MRKTLMTGLRALPIALCSVLSVPTFGAGEPALRLEAVERQPLVGQPVRLVLTFDGFARVVAPGLTDLDSTEAALRILIQQGGTSRTYLGPPRMRGLGDLEFLELPGGRLTIELHLTFDVGIMNWALHGPGKYSLVAEYSDARYGVIRSNSVSMEARMPTGKEREVLAQIERTGWAYVSVVDSDDATYEPIRALVEEHPDSVYLHHVRVNDLRYKLGSAVRNRLGQRLRPSESTIAQLSELANDLAVIETPSAAEALLVLASLRELAGDLIAARTVLQQVVEKHPVGLAAREAQRRLLEMTAEVDHELPSGR